MQDFVRGPVEKLMNALIVEDEMVVARHLATILKKVGYGVCHTVTNVADALSILEQGDSDVVLIDIMLNGERDGIDLAHELRAGYQLPFLFITSHADPATVERAKATHPNGYLVKPFTPEEVYAATEIALINFANAQLGIPRWSADSKGGLPAFKVKRVQAHIQENLDGELSLDELSEVAELSKYYFSRLFKEAVGMPPYEYVLEQRVMEACRCLSETEDSITEIALQTGFSGPSHLSRVFREHMGISPSSFRKTQGAPGNQDE